MKTLNRTLSLVLVLVMVLGLFGVASAKFNDDATIQYKEAVDVAVGIGAIDGYADGTFNPKGDITREEAAKLITYAILGPTLAKTLTVSNTGFKDVASNRWSAPFITYLVNKGIINGMGDGTFDPTGKVTGYQLGKMLLTAIGYGKNGEYTGTSWELNTAVDANKYGIFTGSKAANFTAPATREEAALYVFNGLTKPLQANWDKTKEAYTTAGNNTIATDVYAMVTATGVVSANQATGAAATTVAGTTYNLASGLDLIGHQVTVYYKTTGAKGVAYAIVDNSTTYAIPTTMTTAAALAKALGYTPVFAPDAASDPATYTNIPLFNNYAAGTPHATGTATVEDADVNALKGKTIVIADKKIVSVLSATTYTLDKVTKVTTTAGAESITFATLGTKANNATSDVVKEYDGIAAGDYVIVVSVGGSYWAVTKAQTVVGKVSAIANTTDALTIGEKTYTKDAAYGNHADVTSVTPSSYFTAAVLKNNNTKLFLTPAGTYIAATSSTEASSSAIVTFIAEYTKTVVTPYGNTTEYYQQVVAADGTVASYKSADLSLTAKALYTTTGPNADGEYGFTPVATTGGAPATVGAEKADILDADTTFAPNTLSVLLDNNAGTAAKAYLTANTKFVFYTGTLGTLKTTVATGSISQTINAANAKVVYTKDANGNLVINTVFIDAVSAQTQTDKLYVVDTAYKSVTANGYVFEAYNATTGEKMNIVCASSDALTAGFNTFTVTDGVHALTPATTTDYTFTGAFGTRISATGGSGLTDVEAGNAIVVDVDATTGETPVSGISDFTATTTFNCLTDAKGAITIIFVTNRV